MVTRESAAAVGIPGRQPIWVVTAWEFGGGGDDDRRVIGVFSTAEKAYAAAKPGDDVRAYPLDEVVPHG